MVAIDGQAPSSSTDAHPRKIFAVFSTPMLPSVNTASLWMTGSRMSAITENASRMRFWADWASEISTNPCSIDNAG